MSEIIDRRHTWNEARVRIDLGLDLVRRGDPERGNTWALDLMQFKIGIQDASQLCNNQLSIYIPLLQVMYTLDL